MASSLLQKQASTTPTPTVGKDIIRKLGAGPANLLPHIQSFVTLSAGTEFGFYEEPQWSFLLSGNDVTAFVCVDEEGEGRPCARWEGEDATFKTISASAVAVVTKDDCERKHANTSNIVLKGCVLKIRLDDTSHGLGMVLVNPKHRRQGLAQRLIQAALQDDNDNDIGTNSMNRSRNTTLNQQQPRSRSVLAVCSQLGLPVYRKLNYQSVGMVYALSISLADLQNAMSYIPENNPISTAWKNGGSGTKWCSREGRTALCALDQNATGYDRSDRISLLLDSQYAPHAAATVMFGYDCSRSDSVLCAAAVSRQDYPGGPLIVGPIIGPTEAALPLLWSLARHHPVVAGGDDDATAAEDDIIKKIQVSVLISNHVELVDQLLKVKGMALAWDGPAMSSDGSSIYCSEEGEGDCSNKYLVALLHPTLG